LQQQKKWPRPRDLYDLWYILCKTKERFSWHELKTLFDEKCHIRDVQPDITSLTSDTLRKWNENAWSRQLEPMLKDVPAFDRLWKEWVKTFHRLVAEG
jgi:predicted nucleotidyltransferase component of viral defense system